MDFQLTFLNQRAYHLALISAAKTKLESPTSQYKPDLKKFLFQQYF